jgi:mannose-1-phosphate guanylyltransferase/phosphomannomutase
VDLHDLNAVEGPAFVGNYCRILPEATVGAYSVLNASVTLRESARTTRSVIDTGTHVGRGALIEGAIVGRSCDIRSHVQIGEGVAVGDEVTIGEESVIQPGVRIYPYKEIESGALIHESLIWESRVSSRLFDQWGVSGRVNVDLTPETAIRLATALGTALRKGSRVVASRDAAPACRMIKRAVITGLTAAGVDVADLRVLPAAVNRHMLKVEAFAAGVHVTTHPTDPEVVRIQFHEPPGISLTPALQKEIEKHFTRGELRRAGFNEVGSITYPVRVRESYAQDLLASVDADAIRERGFRVVIDYGYSAASFVLPLVLGPLGVEAVAAHAFTTDRDEGPIDVAALVEQTTRLVSPFGADLGVVFDRAAERLHLVDELGQEISLDRALLLFLRLIGSNGRRGKLAFPVTVTSQVEHLLEGSGLEIVRTPASLAELTKAASGDDFIFAGAVGGGYVFPDFLPGYDAMASLVKLLELLAPVERPLSELVAALPQSALVHERIPCPWSQKGAVMRVLHERLEGRRLDITDGIKVFDERGWVQVLPDPDEPVVHLYAEGRSDEESRELQGELRAIVQEILAAEESAVPA